MQNAPIEVEYEALASPHAKIIADAAFRTSSDGQFEGSYKWQSDLYRTLSDAKNDVGLITMGYAASGKTEAVLIPSLGMHRGGAPRRVFMIESDESPLDDAYYRAVPYLKNFASSDGEPRSLYLDRFQASSADQQCWTYLASGTVEGPLTCSPLDSGVDLVLTNLSRFEEFFFGAGGVNALPSSLAVDDSHITRKNLFFFNEAHRYDAESFNRFTKLLAFLYAEDVDIIVASSTLSEECRAELDFLSQGSNSAYPSSGRRMFHFQSTGNVLASIEDAIRVRYPLNVRTAAVLNTVADAERLYERLKSSYSHNLFIYHHEQAPPRRQSTYAQLRGLEKEGLGYLLITTGACLEASDLDISDMFSTFCSPQKLLLRAGRCNRRRHLEFGNITIYSDGEKPHGSTMNAAQYDRYREAMKSCHRSEFDPTNWLGFVNTERECG